MIQENKFSICFSEGQVLFDFWPADLSETIGRMAVLPWKSCYVSNGAKDSISCGEIVSAHDRWIKVKHAGGFTESSIDTAFLVPSEKK